MNITILLYDGVTALDAVGPYEVLRGIPDAKVRFVAGVAGMKRTDTGFLGLNADQGIDEITSTDILVIPGTPDPDPLLADSRVIDWIKTIHESTTWTTSVCTGALALAAAGILTGRQATTHWLAMKQLEKMGAIPVRERVVREGRILTAAGVSAGIDMALTLVAMQCGKETARGIQLILEYDPQPPLDAGSPDKAPDTAEKLRQLHGEIGG